MSKHHLPPKIVPAPPVTPKPYTLGDAIDASEFVGRTFEVGSHGARVLGLGVYLDGNVALIDPEDGYAWFRPETLRDQVIVRRLNATITYEEVS